MVTVATGVVGKPARLDQAVKTRKCTSSLPLPRVDESRDPTQHLHGALPQLLSNTAHITRCVIHRLRWLQKDS